MNDAARGVDATLLAPRLYQGSRPQTGDLLRRAGFDVIVLCAKEYQPPAHLFPGVAVVRAYLDDSTPPITEREWAAAVMASCHAAKAVAAGRRVLTTCYAGRNRSGLVNALTLHRLTGMSGARAIDHVRMHREEALTNASFVAMLRKLPARRVR